MHFLSHSVLTRRTLLKLTAASLSLAACAPNSSIQKKHIAVIGGGIIGASIAYHLAKEGMKVTLLERNGLAQRASRGTFAWINASWAKQPRRYHRLNQAGTAGWKKLQSELDISIRWGGSLEWFPSSERQIRLSEQIDEQIKWGEPAKMIGRKALHNLEPNVNFGNVDRVAYSPNDGALDPVLATQKLINAAMSLGTKVKTNCSVQGVSRTDQPGATLQTSCGDLAVDQFVLATGADPDAIEKLAAIKIPQRTTPGIIVITQPLPRLINRIIVAPGIHIHQRSDGRIILGEQDGAPDTEAHAQRLQGRPTQFPHHDFAEQHARRMLAIADPFIPGIIEAQIQDVFIGWRPLPLDGHPVLGRSPAQPEAYIAIMHSGVTLAPIIGEIVAREISTGQSSQEISGYRPDRDFTEVKRY